MDGISDFSCLRTWPIRFHRVFLIWSDMAAVWVSCTSLRCWSCLHCQNILRTLRKVFSFGAICHLPGLRARTLFVLNILILVLVLMLNDFQMFRRFAKLAWAFVVLYWTSVVESPLDVIFCVRIQNRWLLIFCLKLNMSKPSPSKLAI